MDLLRHAGRIVVVAREPRETVDQHERVDALGIRGGEHEHHLRRVAVPDQSGALGARRVHDRAHVLHPLLGRDLVADAIREADAAHVEPENAREARQRREEVLDERLLPQHLEVARPVEHEDDVARAVADHLVRDVQASAARIPCPGSRH